MELKCPYCNNIITNKDIEHLSIPEQDKFHEDSLPTSKVLTRIFGEIADEVVRMQRCRDQEDIDFRHHVDFLNRLRKIADDYIDTFVGPKLKKQGISITFGDKRLL